MDPHSTGMNPHCTKRRYELGLGILCWHNFGNNRWGLAPGIMLGIIGKILGIIGNDHCNSK